MANPDRAEMRISRRQFLTPSLTEKEKLATAAVVGVGSGIIDLPLSTDRIKLLSIDGQVENLGRSVRRGAFLGMVVGLLQTADHKREESSRRKFATEIVRKVTESTIAGTIFSSAVAPIQGAWGLLDTYAIQPQLTGKTPDEIMESLQKEADEAEAIRNTYK